jgi:hypothetical protein
MLLFKSFSGDYPDKEIFCIECGLSAGTLEIGCEENLTCPHCEYEFSASYSEDMEPD